MADSYTKVLDVLVNVEKKSYDDFSKKLEKDSKAMTLLFDKEAETLKKNYVETQTKLKKIEYLKEAIAEIKMFGGKDSKKALKELEKQLKTLEQRSFTDSLKQAFSKDGVIGSKIVDTFTDAGKKIQKFITDSFDDAISELKKMSSYNYGTTLFQDSSTMQSALQYGLNGSQAYALDKALEFFGASSIEDTYMWGPQEKEAFAKQIGKYVDKFNSLNDSGFFQKWDEFRYEFKNFKEDMMYDIMQWIMQNKNTIYKGFQALTKLMEIGINILSAIGEMMNIPRTDSQKAAATADIISNYSTSSSKSLTVNNTFNGVQSANKTELINAGNLTYAQLKEALYSY